MRIGIDARPLQTGHKFRGIGTYTRYLLKSLSEIDREDEYVLFADNDYPLPDLSFLESSFRYVVRNCPGFKDKGVAQRRLVQHVIFPREIQLSGIDVFHYTEFNVPFWQPCPTAVTIHDLLHLRLRDMYPHGPSMFRFRKYAARNARMIFAYSECAKQDDVELLGVRADRVVVSPMAVDENFRRVTDCGERQRIRKVYDLPEKYVLYVGGIEARKNIPSLFEMFEALAQRHSDLHLVMLTALDEDKRKLLESCGSRKVMNRVRVYDHIKHGKDLSGVYSMASVYCSASLYETCNLPLLESMACGVPVVVYNNSCHPETVGAGGILVNNDTVGALTDAADSVISNPDLYAELSVKALQQAGRFSWKRMAQETLNGYRAIGRG